MTRRQWICAACEDRQRGRNPVGDARIWPETRVPWQAAGLPANREPRGYFDRDTLPPCGGPGSRFASRQIAADSRDCRVDPTVIKRQGRYS